MLQRRGLLWLALSLTLQMVTSLASAANTAPVISGSPKTSTVAGTAYSFQPKASDANRNTLKFSIKNKPAWASFSTTTGLLSGKPTATGTHYSIVISVSDGLATVSLPSFNLAVVYSSAPTLSGTPGASVTAGYAYSFQPTAADKNKDTLGFSIKNKPAWAAFSTTTGALTGKPTSAQVGSYGNIIISVTDGRATTSLSAFTITVKSAATAAAASTGAATLSWTPPSSNVDGTTLTNLSGYRIYYGTSSSSLSNTVKVSLGLTSYVISNLASGTWYFTMSSVNSSGVESARSAVVTKKI